MNVMIDPKTIPQRKLYTGDTMPCIGMGFWVRPVYAGTGLGGSGGRYPVRLPAV